MQVSKELEEQELLQTFRQFGRILSHTWRRGTNCAYIDYEDAVSATQAKRAMDGAVMYGAALRVEFKVRLNPHPSLSASLVSIAQTVAKFAVAALSAQLKLNRWPLTVWLCGLSICDLNTGVFASHYSAKLNMSCARRLISNVCFVHQSATCCSQNNSITPLSSTKCSFTPNKHQQGCNQQDSSAGTICWAKRSQKSVLS